VYCHYHKEKHWSLIHKTRAKLLNDCFSSVSVKEDLSPVLHIEALSIPVMEPISIKPEGQYQNVFNKVSGPDQIPFLLKSFANYIAPSLVLIFKSRLYQGNYFIQSMRCGHIL